MPMFTVFSLDVLGNTSDGFEVNDSYKKGTLELPDDATNKQIIRAMVDQDYLKSARFKFTIESDPDVMTICHKATGRPLFTLQRNND